MATRYIEPIRGIGMGDHIIEMIPSQKYIKHPAFVKQYGLEDPLCIDSEYFHLYYKNPITAVFHVKSAQFKTLNETNDLTEFIKMLSHMKFDSGLAIEEVINHGSLEILSHVMENFPSDFVPYEPYLVRAAERGHLEIVKYLFENNENNKIHLNTAANQAFRNNHTNVVEYLLSHGATISKTYG